MDAHKARPALALLLALLLSGCAADSTTSVDATAPTAIPAAPSSVPPAPASPTPEPALDPAACDLTASMSVSSWLGNHKINDVGTKECDYLIWIGNTSRTDTLVPLVFQQNMDAFNGTNETHWEALQPVAPGERYDYQGYVYLVNDSRASVPMARIPKTIVAVKLDDACTPFQADPAYLQARAQPVDEPCSSDLLLWPEFRTATVASPTP